VAEKPADLEALKAAKLDDGTVEDAVLALSARIGEKLELKRYIHVDGPVALYLHRRASDLPPAIGALVSYDGGDEDAVKGVAMHIAAARPSYTTRDEVPADVIENERRIAEATAREEGKPEQVLARIVDGRINGYYKDVVLLEQAVRAGAQEDRQGPARRGRRHREDVRALRGRPGLMTDPGVDTDPRPGFRRVLLKLGGEMFGGGAVGVDPEVVETVARQIAEVVSSGAQVAVVIGGGNFFRGAELQDRGMERSRADYMGMLGTVMNCLALQDFLEREHHIDTRVQTAITMGQVAEAYIPRRAIRHLEKGRVVIFGAGVGMPYFSTDTAGAQRALEIGAEALLLAKGVDGVFTADPKTDPGAKLYEEITHREVLEQGLKVADATAFSLCMDNRMPIIVFNLLVEGNIARAVRGERIGTLVSTPGER
jgi:uridylate kinase